jgi:hypothetical protein
VWKFKAQIENFWIRKTLVRTPPEYLNCDVSVFFCFQETTNVDTEIFEAISGREKD